jgi:hypothetical protein
LLDVPVFWRLDSVEWIVSNHLLTLWKGLNVT